MSSTKSFISLFYLITWKKVVQIGSLVTEIQNIEENVFLILYNVKLFKKYEKHRKKFISDSDCGVLFFFWFSVWTLYFVYINILGKKFIHIKWIKKLYKKSSLGWILVDFIILFYWTSWINGIKTSLTNCFQRANLFQPV